MSVKPKVQSTMGDDLDRGMMFASALFAAVHEHSPPQLATDQREALGRYLLESAVEWVKAYNRQAARNQGRAALDQGVGE